MGYRCVSVHAQIKRIPFTLRSATNWREGCIHGEILSFLTLECWHSEQSIVESCIINWECHNHSICYHFLAPAIWCSNCGLGTGCSTCPCYYTQSLLPTYEIYAVCRHECLCHGQRNLPPCFYNHTYRHGNSTPRYRFNLTFCPRIIAVLVSTSLRLQLFPRHPISRNVQLHAHTFHDPQ